MRLERPQTLFVKVDRKASRQVEALNAENREEREGEAALSAGGACGSTVEGEICVTRSLL